jgi:hypothetical protein
MCQKTVTSLIDKTKFTMKNYNSELKKLNCNSDNDEMEE